VRTPVEGKNGGFREMIEDECVECEFFNPPRTVKVMKNLPEAKN
jgi:hypothetical protein